MKKVLLLLFILSTACSSKQSQDQSEIHTFLEDYYAAMTSRNWKVYQQFFWPKATITTIWQKPGDNKKDVNITTIEDFVSQTHLGPDSQPIFEENMTDANISVKGNIATAWVNYEARFGSKENLMEWAGKDLFTLMKHEGKWRIVSLAFESDENSP